MNCIIFHSISTLNATFPLLDAQVNVLLDAEAKVAVVGEVLLPQLVLLHLEAPLQDLLGLYCQNQLCVWQKPVHFLCFVLSQLAVHV